MAIKCPNCGKTLHWYDFRAECKYCGANIPNYDWEGRLEQDRLLYFAQKNEASVLLCGKSSFRKTR